MRALSLWQPWASAMALGWKRIETRHWGTAYRGPLAIHAAKRWTADEREEWEIACETYGLIGTGPPPLGAIVAVAQLVDVRPTESLWQSISPEEREWGNYGLRRYGWLCENIRALPAPIPFKGMQGLFDIPDSVFGPGYVPPAPIPRPAPPPPRQGMLI